MFACTFYDLLAKNRVEHASHPMLIAPEGAVSFAEVGRRVDALAGWLARVGVRRGDRIAVQLPKSVDEVIVMFAAARVGAVFVNIHYRWTAEQLDYVLRDCEVVVLFVQQRLARTLAASQIPETLRSIVVKGVPPAHPKMIGWNTLPDDLTPPERVGIDTDLAAILYTSGSTGAPKGVMLSHLNLLQGARSVATYLENIAADRVLSLLPFSFDYGLSQLTTMCLVGGSVVLQLAMMPAEIVRALAEHRITGFAAVPSAWIPIVRFLVEQPTALPHLRYITNSGGKIPDSTLEMMPSVFSETKIYLMYGLTEAFRSTYLPPELFQEKIGSIGKAIPNVETYVISADDEICGPGQQGELVHRGSLISMGYWGKPEATAEKIKPCPTLKGLIGDEKVVYSGDIVRIDADGYYWFVGRRDAMIKSSGFRISPTEVEDIVFRSGLVSEVVAFGAEDELLGQVVEIAVTTASGSVSEEEVLQYCRQKMPAYMVPRTVHGWTNAFPRTGSGKIDRPLVIRGCVDGQAQTNHVALRTAS